MCFREKKEMSGRVQELGGSKQGAVLNTMASAGLLEKAWHAQSLKVGEGFIRQTSGWGRAFQEGDAARARP